MADKRPLNYSTTIAASRTVSQCQELLAAAGAKAVAVMYERKEPTGLSFRLNAGDRGSWGTRDFVLPVNLDGVGRMLAAMLQDDPPHVSRSELTRIGTRQHAVNVAWRVVRDWLEAQLAIIAAGMASIDEVMLPYLEVSPGETLYQRYVEQHGPAALT